MMNYEDNMPPTWGIFKYKNSFDELYPLINN